MTSNFFLLSSLFALTACPGSPHSLASGVEAAAAGGDLAVADSTSGCPEGTHATDDGRCGSDLILSRSTQTITPARNHHTTVIAQPGQGAFLYVLGGTDSWQSVIFSDVQRAQIMDDGSLAPFQKVGDLPEPLSGHTTVVVDNHLVVAGGVTDFVTSREVASTFVAILNADGSLGAWSAGPDLPEPAMHHTCNVNASDIYCIGGRKDGNYTTDLAVRTRLRPDGTLTPYQAVTPLPSTRGFHEAFIEKGALYVVSGLRRDPPMADFQYLTDALRAPLADDGSLGAWQVAGDLPDTRQVASVSVLAGRAYFLGGMNGDDAMVDTILAASFGADGAIAVVDVLSAKLSVARAHVHQTPIYRHWIYSVGGMLANGSPTGIIDVGTFD